MSEIIAVKEVIKMKDISKVTTLCLAHRLNEIMKELEDMQIKNINDLSKQEELDNEHNEIVMELWKRIPPLKEDVNIQPKRKVKKNDR